MLTTIVAFGLSAGALLLLALLLTGSFGSVMSLSDDLDSTRLPAPRDFKAPGRAGEP